MYYNYGLIEELPVGATGPVLVASPTLGVQNIQLFTKPGPADLRSTIQPAIFANITYQQILNIVSASNVSLSTFTQRVLAAILTIAPMRFTRGMPGPKVNLIPPAGKIFTQILNVVSGSTVTIQNQVGKILTFTSASVVSLSTFIQRVLVAVTMSVPLDFRPGSGPRYLRPPASFTLGTLFSQTLNIVSGSTVTLQNQVGKGLSFTSASVVSLTIFVQRVLAAILTVAPMRFRQGAPGARVNQPQFASLNLGQLFSRTLTIVSGSTVSLTKQVSKILSFNGPSLVTLQNQVGKILSVITSGSTVTLQNQVGKVLTFTSASVVNLQKLVGKILSFSSGSVVSLSTFVQRVLVAILTVSPMRFRPGAHGPRVNLIPPAFIQLGNLFFQTLNVVSGSVVTLQNQVGKVLTFPSASVITLQRNITKGLTIVAASTVTTIKALNKTLATFTSGSTVSLQNLIGKIFSFSSSSIVSLATFKRVLVAVLTFAPISRRLGKVIPNTTSGVTAPIVGKILNTGRQLIGRATNYLTGQVTNYFTTGRSTYKTIGTVNMQIHDPYDFICGTSWQEQGPLLDAFNNPIPLTGATIQWRLDSIDGATNFITLNLGAGITITDSPSSTILVDANKTQTNLPPGLYRDILVLTLANGDPLPMWGGIIRASANPA